PGPPGEVRLKGFVQTQTSIRKDCPRSKKKKQFKFPERNILSWWSHSCFSQGSSDSRSRLCYNAEIAKIREFHAFYGAIPP
ncbi:MAG: hypothetical protein ACP5DY_04955, partial [Thermovirgaceae bacterium]